MAKKTDLVELKDEMAMMKDYVSQTHDMNTELYQ